MWLNSAQKWVRIKGTYGVLENDIIFLCKPLAGTAENGMLQWVVHSLKHVWSWFSQQMKIKKKNLQNEQQALSGTKSLYASITVPSNGFQLSHE